MSPVVALALFGWFGVAAALFSALTPRRAVIASIAAGWMFLPIVLGGGGGLRWAKFHSVALAALAMSVTFHPAAVARLRPRWCDLPIIGWCLCPVPSSLDNGLGLYDGLNQAFHQTVAYGVPWLLGRAYFRTPADLRDLALGLVAGGVGYIPVCVYEVLFSPSLHLKIYGYHQHSFLMHIRYGGYRPMAFMDNGIMVGLWMSASVVTAFWLWRTRVLTERLCFGVPAGLVVAALGWTAVICKSTGALALGALGLAAMWVAGLRYGRPFARSAIAGLLVLAPVYIAVRAARVWDGDDLVRLVAEHLSPDRAQSLQFRFDNEEPLVDKAFERPLFGWGGWGRARIFDEKTGRDLSTTDALWIIGFGDRGLTGLALVYAAMLWPSVRFAAAVPIQWWSHPAVAPAAALAVVLVMWTLDSLLNAGANPYYLLAGGALAGVAWNPPRPVAAQPPAPPRRAAPPGRPRRSAAGSPSAAQPRPDTRTLPR